MAHETHDPNPIAEAARALEAKIAAARAFHARVEPIARAARRQRIEARRAMLTRRARARAPRRPSTSRRTLKRFNDPPASDDVPPRTRGGAR